MPGHFLEIPVFLGDCFIMPHPHSYTCVVVNHNGDHVSATHVVTRHSYVVIEENKALRVIGRVLSQARDTDDVSCTCC